MPSSRHSVATCAKKDYGALGHLLYNERDEIWTDFLFYENSGDSPGMTRHLLRLLLLRRCRRWSLQTQHWAESPPPPKTRLLRRRPLPRCSWAAAENGDEKDGGSPSSSQKSPFLFYCAGVRCCLPLLLLLLRPLSSSALSVCGIIFFVLFPALDFPLFLFLRILTLDGR